MREHSEQNRRAWDEIHRRRHESHGAKLGLSDELLERLEPLEGMRVLHLQCATGETTAQLVARGAAVTGIDISGEALAIAEAAVPQATFVRADALALPELGEFDLVLTEGGVLVWLHDLETWAAGVAHTLRPGGTFVVIDGHPVAGCVDTELRWVGEYFDESMDAAVGWGHFELTGQPAREESREWAWTLGSIVTAVARSGLRIEELVELPSDPSDWRGLEAGVPGRFVLRATKT